jgi:hypothetical protein
MAYKDFSLKELREKLHGAQIFNKNLEQPQEVIYGCVTTGDNWLFLELRDKHLTIDQDIYPQNDPAKVLGVLQEIVNRFS